MTGDIETVGRGLLILLYLLEIVSNKLPNRRVEIYAYPAEKKLRNEY